MLGILQSSNLCNNGVQDLNGGDIECSQLIYSVNITINVYWNFMRTWRHTSFKEA